MPETGFFPHYLQRSVIYTLVFAIPVLLLANIFLIYQNSKVIEHNKLLQDDAEAVKVNTLNIIRILHQMDMGLRGYALIDSEVQLNLATIGFKQMDSTLLSLENSLTDQQYNMPAFYNMKDSVYWYLDIVRDMINMIKDGRKQAFNEILKKDPGYEAYKAYIRYAGHVISFEDHIAVEARRQYNLALRNSYLLQIMIFVVTVPALLYMVYLFNKTFKISENLRLAEQKNNSILSMQKEYLERQVQERTNEIVAKNEEMVAHNDQLLLQQHEIAMQHEALAEKNQKLEDAYNTIEQQHQLIQEKNQELNREISLQTRDLRKTNHELIEKQPSQQFSYIISHNLRAPIARFVGLSDILKYAQSEKEKNDIIDLMIKTTSEFDEVLKDLTYIISIQKLNTKVYSKVTLAEVVEKVLATLEHEIQATQARINTDFSKAPALYSLPQYIESIFYNLISNALKYRHPDREPLVTVKSQKTGNNIVVSVSDNGLGIDLGKHKSALFNLYKRFHFHVEGKGLGLYLVRTQTEALGARINLESKPSTGSVFKIKFKDLEQLD